ncbi:DNA-processing protein DprA [Candidatus Woesebacteria bacterium]|nr:DNA-processing protein DprA [Candidatus Woesebacteria bacterium]
MNYKDYKIQKIKLGDKNYPKNLSLIKNPPKFLFSRENPNKNIFKKSIAIVGSRSITRYGKDIIDRFVSFFASQKITTISGFMYGVDSEVHKKTIEYGGLTSAVFGCGLDVIYPPENEKLYSDILNSGGMIFSEYQNNAKPHLWKFPQRNRIVSGLSSFGVLVIEAALKSGSLLKKKKKKFMQFLAP